MLKEVEWSEDRSYRSGTNAEPIQFYLDGLCNSTSFDLLLGYFSSAAISVLSLGFASFLYSNGKVRMVANNVLSQNDRDAIIASKDGKIPNGFLDLTDIRQLRRTLDEYGTHFFECLAWLFANGKFDLKIIRPKHGMGISHYKSGAFSDGINTVGFKASCNFTAFGLLENLEELDAFLSWENSRSSKMINRQQNDFESIFNGTADFVEYLQIEDIEIAVKMEFGGKSIDELVIQEIELIEKKSRILENRKVRNSFEKIITRIEKIVREPRFPYIDGPRDYQKDANKNWLENDCKGIFAMATGTGKTITALNCVLELYRVKNFYKAVILVPTVGLAEQWEEESKKFNFRNIIKINSTTNWQADLALLDSIKHFTDTSFIIIVTYASFYRPKFQEFFKRLSGDTVLIGDEVHNMGSPTISKLLPFIHLDKRIGLSATPKRIYDEEGNTVLDNFFNDKDPYLFRYSMEEAIKNDVLCNYLYFPHIIELTDVEFDEYLTISKQLAKFFDTETNKYKNDSFVEMLLLKRKRILHKAENKKHELEKILHKEFRSKGDLKYTLVYVPEGGEPDYSINDFTNENEDDLSLINQYTKIVSRIDRSIMVKQFTSGSQNRDKLIRDYSNGDVHVLTSMKCLDEGIDVPRSEMAVFCSSTGNPRQFIQRRGRILRKHKDKVYAVIHDLVVIPKRTGDESTYLMERSLVRKELERVVNFSDLADNKTDTYDTFEWVLEHYNLNLNDFETKN
jgi:superfamily II DNA or RNA helicase